MFQIYGKFQSAGLLLHGGAGPADPNARGRELAQTKAEFIALQCLKEWMEGDGAPLAAARACLQHLESEPCFNAGLGSTLQMDGLARTSASLMDGGRQTFSGIVSVPYLRHPSVLAEALQQESARVLTSPGAELLARRMHCEVDFNLTAERVEIWRARFLKEQGIATAESDTVGCVLFHRAQGLASGSSTGGRGYEWPGRVSDSPTVAGNYASRFVAVTATGIGEEIVDDAVCARIETRVRDGMSLKASCEHTFSEALERSRSYGWIAVDREGNWAACTTTSAMTFAAVENGRLLSQGSH